MVRPLALLAVLCLLLGSCTGSSGPTPPTGTEATGAAAAPPPRPSERLGLETGWGPSRKDLDRAARWALAMPLDHLAGQVVVARWPGGTVPPVDLVRRLHLGGLVVFDANVASAAGLRRAVGTLDRSVRRPLLLAVDQEGGLVQRVRGGATVLPAFMSAGAADQPRLTRTTYAAAGRELAWLGLDMVLAPDTDVTTGPADPVIGSRSPGSDPRLVARHGVAAARGYRDVGVLPVLKHFPGHGSLRTDSHLALPVQPRGPAQLRATDLVPFRAAVENGLPSVMIGHIAVPALDAGVPATVSRPVVQGLLRDQMGFAGLVVSDALEMRALRGVPRPAVGFLRAGGDVVLMPPDPEATVRAVAAAVRQGALPRRRLQQAAARSLAAQAWIARRTDPAAPGSARPATRRLSGAALTSVAGPCSGPVLREPPVPLGDPAAVASFRAAAAAAGVPLGQVRTVRPPKPERTGRAERDRRLLRQWRRAPDRRVVEGTPVHLVGTGDPAPDTGIVVAVDRPYVLGGSRAAVRLASFGSGPLAMSAVLGFLRGVQPAPGRLPVAVPGVPRRGC